MSLSLQEILDAKDEVIEKVPVPEWGGDVFVRSVSGTQRDAFDQSQYEDAVDGKVSMKNFRAKVVALGLCDEEGVPLAGQDKVMALGAKSCVALSRVFDVSKRLNGIGDDEVGDLEKNSDAGQTSSSD